MLRIETAINDSRFFCSSALLRDWEWNEFDKFLKLIRSSSHFSALQCIRDSSLCSCHFGHENIKKINLGLSRVWTGRPGLGSTLRVDRIWPSQFPAFFCLDPARPQARVGRVPSWPAGPGRVLKHWTKVNLIFITAWWWWWWWWKGVNYSSQLILQINTC